MNRLFLLLFGAMSLVAHAQVPNYVPSDGLVAWYPFDSNSLDAHDAALHGTTTQVAYVIDRWGTPESAIQIQGDGLVDFGTDDAFGVTTGGDKTFSFWVKSEIGAIPRLQKYQNSIASTSNFFIGPAPLPPFQDSTGITVTARGTDAYTLVNFEMSEWFHVAAIYLGEQEESELYINGSLALQGSLQFNHQISTQPMQLTASRVSNDYPDSNGEVDDLGVWDRALTETEIQTLYLAAFSAFGCIDSSACNYDSSANLDDGTCEFGCLYCGEGTVWDSNTSSCIVANPTDTDLDGCTGVGDVLEVLSTFGQCYTTWACGDPMNYNGYDYATVLIGDQCWFAENLRATAFNDGTDIAYVSEANAWTSADSPARCWHDNTEDSWPNGGFLYNGYVITNERNVCPEDWSPAADEDWKSVESLHGMPEAELDQMDITRGADEFVSRAMSGTTWNQGTNDLGLNVIPGGYRIWNTGVFSGLPTAAFWAISGCEGFYREMNELWDGVNRSQRIFNQGFSVRCIKD